MTTTTANPTCCSRPMRRMNITAPAVELTLFICGRCENRQWLADGRPVAREVVLEVAQTFRSNVPRRRKAA